MYLDGHAPVLNLYFIGPFRNPFIGDTVPMMQIAHSHGTPHEVGICAMGVFTDELPIAVDGLVMIDERLGVLERKKDQFPFQALLFLLQKGLASDKISFFQFDGKSKAGLQRRVIRRDVAAPMAVSFFQAERVNGMQSHRLNPQRFTLAHQFIINTKTERCRYVELPAKFAHKTHPDGKSFGISRIDLLGRSIRECLAGQILTGHF